MSQSDLNSRLSQAIALVQTGNRAEGYAILIPLSQEFPEVEQVWLWLASATDDPAERVESLRRVLSINPRNNKARIALTRLTGEVPAVEEAPTVLPGNTSFSTRRLESWLIAIIGMAAIVLVIVALSLAIPIIFAPKPTPTLTFTPSRTFTPSLTFTASVTPGGPTLTPAGFQTLPPSWTPVPSSTPSLTPTPSDTPIPTETFTISPTPSLWPTLTVAPTITPGGPSFTPQDTYTPSPTIARSPQSTIGGAPTLPIMTPQ